MNGDEDASRRPTVDEQVLNAKLREQLETLQGGLMTGIVVLTLMIVFSAISSKGIMQTGCYNNSTTLGYAARTMVNTMTFGVYGLVEAYRMRNAQFQSMGLTPKPVLDKLFG